MTLHPNHCVAIADLRLTFGRERVAVSEPGDGTAIVTVADVDVGQTWIPALIALTVHLAVTFPTTAVYPYYVTAGLKRNDGRAVPNMSADIALGGQTFNQVSLTSSPLRSGETLSERLLSAISWFRSA